MDEDPKQFSRFGVGDSSVFCSARPLASLPMTDSRSKTQLLAGIGLVLVGLLSGILVTLIVDDEPEQRPVARIVERVEAGSSSPSGTTQTTAGAARLAEEGGPQPAALNRLFRDVASQVREAVVSVRVQPENQTNRDGQELSPEDLFGNRPPRQSLGSGVLISPDGYIVTNHHVVKQAGDIQVTMVDKRQFEGRIVGTDVSTDLAVIKIDGEGDFPVLPLGNSDNVEVGDWVVAIGNPFNLTSTVTAGIVSALGRQGIIEENFRVENFIQTDAAINRGNSGGALVNLKGELIGINTAIASGSGSYEGYGFAIPATLVDHVVTDLIAYGEVRRGYLGVSIREVDEEVAQSVGLDEIRGVYVGDVRSGSAADQAGLQSGDIVVSVMGERVDAPNQLQSLIVRKRPGDVVSVRVWRDGVERSYKVELMGEDTPVYQDWLSDLRSSSPNPGSGPQFEAPNEENRPESEETTITEVDDWAMGIRPLKPEEKSHFGSETGAYVAYVENGGRADAAGMPRDVVITHLDDTPVKTPSDAVQYLSETTSPVLVQVQRRDGTKAFYEVD